MPRAPGTVGSLASLLAAWPIVFYFGEVGLTVALILLLPLACWSCARVLHNAPDELLDPGWIVIDEWLGMWLCLLFALWSGHDGWPWWLAAFGLFRLFDILKPWPVSAAESWGAAWWAINADDLVAGLLGGAVLLTVAAWL